MLKRIKNIWKLNEYRVESPDLFDQFGVGKLGAKLIKDELGDGKAEFLGDGSQEEFAESEKERKGFKGIFGIGK